MIRTDLHMHTIYGDGRNTPEEMVLSALSMGMERIGFSAHSSVPFNPREGMTGDCVRKYIDEITGLKEKYRGRIETVYRQYITEMLDGRKIRPAHIFITESGEVDPAVIGDLSKLVLDLSGCRELHHTLAGCTVSTHCGPGTLGVLFIEE